MQLLRLAVPACLFVLGGAATTLLLSATTQDSRPATRKAPQEMSQEEQMKMWQEYLAAAEPAKQHKELMQWDGEWTQDITTTMPGSPAMQSKSTMQAKAILGGRFLQMHSEGSMMGMKYTDLTIVGYDNVLKKFVAVNMSTMSTGMHFTSGTETKPGTTDMRGQMKDLMTPKGRPFRVVIHSHGKDHFTQEIYDTIPPHGEVMIMKIDSRRKDADK